MIDTLTLHTLEISPRLVNSWVGWFLQDTSTWIDLRRLYVGTKALPDGTLKILGKLPIPPHPRGIGGEWRKIFQTVHHRFRRDLMRSSSPEDARWISYGLSYIALRACTARDRGDQMAYVYKACVNAHRKHLRAPEHSPISLDFDVEVEPVGDSDLRLDVESALGRLGNDDASIARWHMIDDESFEAIGRRLNLNKSTVQRRYVSKILPALRRSLADYDDVVTVVPIGLVDHPASVAA